MEIITIKAKDGSDIKVEVLTIHDPGFTTGLPQFGAGTGDSYRVPIEPETPQTTHQQDTTVKPGTK